MNQIIQQALGASVPATMIVVMMQLASGAAEIKTRAIVFFSTFMLTFILVALSFKKRVEKS